jgi:hypothetical protein
MSETRPMPKIPEGVFTPEQLEKINGGLDLCSATQIQEIFSTLQQNYESLVGFTSYVIERVADSVGYTPGP